MAGTGWKATGIVFLVLGAILFFVGIAGAVFGGVVANDAVGDASRDCGFFSPCDETAGDRAEAGVMAAIAGGLAAGLGILFLLVGTILVVVGIVVGRKATPAPASP